MIMKWEITFNAYENEEVYFAVTSIWWVTSKDIKVSFEKWSIILKVNRNLSLWIKSKLDELKIIHETFPLDWEFSWIIKFSKEANKENTTVTFKEWTILLITKKN